MRCRPGRRGIGHRRALERGADGELVQAPAVARAPAPRAELDLAELGLVQPGRAVGDVAQELRTSFKKQKSKGKLLKNVSEKIFNKFPFSIKNYNRTSIVKLLSVIITFITIITK